MATGTDEARLYKIGEVCRMADVQPYVLRYWETEFPPLAPNKSGGGQRLYTQREIDLVLRIKQLLYAEGFTIAGAKKKLDADANEPAKEASAAKTAGLPPKPLPVSDEARKLLISTRRELSDLLRLLDEE